MMGIVYAGTVLLILLVIFVSGAIQEKKQYQRFCISLKENYGKVPQREYSADLLFKIASYHKKMKEVMQDENKFILDEITWNDLSMDELFIQINATQSSVGEEYLYHMLHCPGLRSDCNKSWLSLVAFLDKNTEKRIEIQKIMHKCGYVNKISLTEMLDYMLDLERENNIPHYLIDIGLLFSFILIFITPGPGVLAFFSMMAISIISYFRRKGEISAYFTTFLYILQMLLAAKEIEKLNYAELSAETEKLKKLNQCFQKFKKNTYVLSTGTHTTDNILELLLDYIRMLFHVDIIKFNSMLKTVQEGIPEIEELRAILGRLDAAAAVASYENSLPYYCNPQFLESDSAELILEEAYHPLVSEPVANSITANKSVLITGSNASGKSTFLKTTAICAIFAQTIGVVPARRYHGSSFRIYSSMALKDSIQTKESYFIVEIKSLKRIVDAAQLKRPLLCFVDEVLRGTNTVERISASTQILKSLCMPHVLCFAATHDIELTQLLEDSYTNYHFNEKVVADDVIFNYQLHEGRAETRNAIKLLSILGYEKTVIEKAEHMAEQFINTGKWVR